MTMVIQRINLYYVFLSAIKSFTYANLINKNMNITTIKNTVTE